MAEKQGVLLSSIAGFPAEVIHKLAGLWITTAEELVSVSVMENGLTSLAEFLSISLDDLTPLVEQASASLPPGVVFDASDVSRFGLGALDRPEEEEPDDRSVDFALLPPQVDLHAKLPPVRNQGQRGTCVAFVCTAVREYLLGISNQVGDFSEQFLYWDCKKRDLLPTSGTWIHIAMNVLKEDGICTEQAWPYNPVNIPGNEGQDPPPPEAKANARLWRIGDPQKLPARWPDILRSALADNSPVAIAVPVYTYWFTEPVRTTGDIRLPLSADHLEGGHAMCMVGYRDDPDLPGGGFFIVRNSWGTDWAAQGSPSAGHARLPYAYITRFASAAYIANKEFIQEKHNDSLLGRFRHWWYSIFKKENNS
jgi:hypothetical protein